MSSQRYLQTLLNFNDTDLNANRRGNLSKAQIEALQAQASHELKLLMVLPILVIAWIVLSLEFSLALPSVFIIGCLIAGIVGLHREQLKTYKDKPIREISGNLRKTPPPGKLSRSQYTIHIGDEHLAVDPHLYEQLPEGKFTLYMLQDKILSVESGASRSPSSPKTSAKPAKKAAPARSVTSAKTSTKKPVATKTAKPRNASTTKKSATPKPSNAKPKLAKATGASKKKTIPLTRTRESVASANQKSRH